MPSIREAAAVLGKDIKTVRRYIHQGKLAAHQEPGPFGPQWMITDADLWNFQHPGQTLEIYPPASSPPPGHPLDTWSEFLVGLRADQDRQYQTLLARIDALEQMLAPRTRPWWMRWWDHWKHSRQ